MRQINPIFYSKIKWLIPNKFLKIALLYVESTVLKAGLQILLFINFNENLKNIYRAQITSVSLTKYKDGVTHSLLTTFALNISDLFSTESIIPSCQNVKIIKYLVIFSQSVPTKVRDTHVLALISFPIHIC
jgi:hypothetical protein